MEKRVLAVFSIFLALSLLSLPAFAQPATTLSGDSGCIQTENPVELLEQLKQAILELNLHSGLENGLTAKLDEASSALADYKLNNDHVAINKVQDFIDQVSGQRGKKISETDADGLLAAAEAVITSCECIVTVELNDRNAYEDGAAGIALFDPIAEEGIIECVSFRASGLLPNHEYVVWNIIQDAGEFDPILTISPNLFQAYVTTDQQGNLNILQMGFPGPAAPLEPGQYRVDTFVTHRHWTWYWSQYEANLIREAHLGGVKPLVGYDLLLSSAPFSTGTEVTVLSQD